MAAFHLFLWLSTVSLYICTTSSPLLKDTLVNSGNLEGFAPRSGMGQGRPLLPLLFYIQGWEKQVNSCEYTKHNVCAWIIIYLLIIVLFIIINLLFPTLVALEVLAGTIKQEEKMAEREFSKLSYHKETIN